MIVCYRLLSTKLWSTHCIAKYVPKLTTICPLYYMQKPLSSTATRVGHQTEPTLQDIKRRALQRINADKDIISDRDSKEVLLFESTRHEFYRNVSLFGLFQYVLWVIIGNVVLYWYVNEYKKLADVSHIFYDPLMKWSEKIKQAFLANKYYMLATISLTTIGHLAITISMLLSTRFIWKIILRPKSNGIDTIRFYCYSVYGLPNNVHTHEFLVNNMSALRPRLNKHMFIPFQVKGFLFKFRCDTNGHFGQPLLFDETVVVYRKL